MSSLRPEAGGVLAAMVAMNVLLSKRPMSGEGMDRPEQTRVSVYIDNKALISRINNWKYWGSDPGSYELVEQT